MTAAFTHRAAALILLATLGAGQGLAAGTAAQDHGLDSAHSHDHTHEHDHENDRTVAKGYFDDAQVAPRPLSDWEGDWQSVFPYLTGGHLDAVMADKAAHGDKTAAEYRAYYETGYRTDIDRIEIAGDRLTFHRGDASVSGRYAPDGYEILTYEAGNRGVRFVFAKVEGDADAPQFIQFSDHRIAPETSDHYHLYMGEDRAELLAQMENWPTYYPAALSAEQIADEMMAH